MLVLGCECHNLCQATSQWQDWGLRCYPSLITRVLHCSVSKASQTSACYVIAWKPLHHPSSISICAAWTLSVIKNANIHPDVKSAIPPLNFYIHLNFGTDHFVHTRSDEPIWWQAERGGGSSLWCMRNSLFWIETMSLLGEKHMKCLPILKRAFIMQGVCFQFISLWHIWCWLVSPSNPHDETWHCPFMMNSTSFLHSWFQSDNPHTYKTDGTILANYNLNSGVRTWKIANFTAEHQHYTDEYEPMMQDIRGWMDDGSRRWATVLGFSREQETSVRAIAHSADWGVLNLNNFRLLSLEVWQKLDRMHRQRGGWERARENGRRRIGNLLE